MSNLSYLGKLKGVDNFGLADKWENTKNFFVDNLYDWIVEPRDSAITDIKLHIYGTETMSLTADITDNYVENNTAYQDHIALKPKVFTVSGEVGELTWYKKDKEEAFAGIVTQKLQPVVAFLPPVSKTVSSIQDKTLKILSVVDSLDNFANRIWNLLSGDDVNTEQKKIYKYLMLLWQSRTPININTPYGKVQNYVIQNLEFTQPDRTKDKTQVKISFKEYRQVIQTKTTAFNKEQYQQRAAFQKASKENVGTTTGIKATAGMCKANQWCPEGLSTGQYNDWKPAPGD